MPQPNTSNSLKLIRLGIEAYRENIIFIRSDCNICTSEGSTLPTRVRISTKNSSIVATLNPVHTNILKEGEASLSEIAFQRLEVAQGDTVSVSHLLPINSLSDVRSKIYGNKLSDNAIKRIIVNVNEGLYSDIELSAFITACAGDHLDLDEITSLTKAMATVGKQLYWDKKVILDKHCIGGLPGNRTTPIVVAIIAEAGYTIPKTSSRAITSPAGTADTMEVFTNVNLTFDDIKEVVNKEGGCLAWGAVAKLSPTDDMLISVEKALDIDSEGQMIASVLSKKAAAGSTHILIDIPVGTTAKVRTEKDALKLKYYFKSVGQSIGLVVESLITDGSQPIGRGIGPALEAMDIIAIFQNEKDAPQDLKEKSLMIAGAMLDMVSNSEKGKGAELAKQILESGRAWNKFKNICIAQGGFQEPEYAKFKKEIFSTIHGTVVEIDNRRLAKIAKLAGAPNSKAAGIYFCAPIGIKVEQQQLLYIVYAESENELKYALDYIATTANPIVKIE
jgi:thymidine phosphorylase